MERYYIPDCKYYVTYEGRLFDKETDKEFIPVPNKNGYVYITIKGKRIKLHRIIAEHWLLNPDNKPQIDHKNRNKRDNSVDNLEWVTATENSYNRNSNLNPGERKCDLNPTRYKTERHKEWRHKHRDEYNAKRRERRRLSHKD